MEKLNPNGGAIAFGHPNGMSGVRITVSLMSELKRRNGSYGIASLCIGGGQGLATIFERLGKICKQSLKNCNLKAMNPAPR